ncbi:GNAT family N-acetyltransferase [Bacillus sp. KH172YL63]|uniref:GNAT family N-acetyltransferase n=1 Tax=Bacillus sp. KH172YL63 TaxID=2709784 RepID=UPI0013E45795|nr:GNAT family N-acetyltransferase [Bacillus sp. KH172YL63]BCB03925.1 hypothetical protein KH172YL63_20580 [Bacillus sp. KH172YL63]
MMNLQLEKVDIDRKATLKQLLELYLYEFSAFTLEDVNETGRFEYDYLDHYWTEEGRVPYFIMIDGSFAGFALIRHIEEENERYYSVAEFFVLKKFRSCLIGRQAANRLFNHYQGNWNVGVLKENHSAREFWRSTVSSYTEGMYNEEINSEGNTEFTFASGMAGETHSKSTSFMECLDSFLAAWRSSSIHELEPFISKQYRAREIKHGEIIDFGYEESISGWEQGFDFVKENRAASILQVKATIPLKKDEFIAIIHATIELDGKKMETANLFFNTFKKSRDGEWALLRSYIESGIQN